MLQGTGYLRRELVETGTPRGRTARILYDAEHNWQRRTGRVCGRVTGLALRVLRFNCASHSLACGRVRMEAPLISSALWSAGPDRSCRQAFRPWSFALYAVRATAVRLVETRAYSWGCIPYRCTLRRFRSHTCTVIIRTVTGPGRLGVQTGYTAVPVRAVARRPGLFLA